MPAFEPMPTEFNLEAEMEMVRSDIATTMTTIYRLKLKEKYYTRKILSPEKYRGDEQALGQTQAQIKAESDYLKMLREIENELNTKITAETPTKEVKKDKTQFSAEGGGDPNFPNGFSGGGADSKEVLAHREP